jgi:thiopurine S-methyltransferase
MKADFWHERWQQNQIGFHQAEINSHLQAYWDGMGLEPEAPVFVPLCGKSRDLLWLRSQGHPVLGVELSPIAVEAFFSENRIEATVERQGAFERWRADGLDILCGDVFDLTADDLHGVAGVYDRASLVALPPAMRTDYAAHLKASLPREAAVLLVTMEYPQAEMDGPPFSVSEAEVRDLYQDAYIVERLFTLDALAENPPLREKGLSALEEKVYRLAIRDA